MFQWIDQALGIRSGPTENNGRTNVEYNRSGFHVWFFAINVTSYTSLHILYSVLFQIGDLHEGKTYVFKVRAVNEAGIGKSSEVSEPVLMETRAGMLCNFQFLKKIEIFRSKIEL